MDENEFMHEEERKMKEWMERKESKVLSGNYESPEEAKEFTKFLEKNGWVVEYCRNVSGYNSDSEEVRRETGELWDEFCRQ